MNDEVTAHDDIRMPLTSADVTAERLEKLRELFPEAFTEGKVDFERLRQALGDVVDTGVRSFLGGEGGGYSCGSDSKRGNPDLRA